MYTSQNPSRRIVSHNGAVSGRLKKSRAWISSNKSRHQGRRGLNVKFTAKRETCGAKKLQKAPKRSVWSVWSNRVCSKYPSRSTELCRFPEWAQRAITHDENRNLQNPVVWFPRVVTTRCRTGYGSPTPATTKLQDTITQWLFGISENQTYRWKQNIQTFPNLVSDLAGGQYKKYWFFYIQSW